MHNSENSEKRGRKSGKINCSKSDVMTEYNLRNLIQYKNKLKHKRRKLEKESQSLLKSII